MNPMDMIHDVVLVFSQFFPFVWLLLASLQLKGKQKMMKRYWGIVLE